MAQVGTALSLQQRRDELAATTQAKRLTQNPGSGSLIVSMAYGYLGIYSEFESF
jgi:hypothetical protein